MNQNKMIEWQLILATMEISSSISDILKDKNNKENKTPQRKQNMEIDQN